MSPGRRSRSVTVTAVGHPAIRATHDKTLELTADAALTPRATCVVGVSAVFDAEALARLRGPVVYEISAGDERGSGTAVINPDHAVADRFVIRRSRHASGETLAVGADGAAADLPRELAAALAMPERPVTFTVTEQQAPPPLVIVASSEPAGRLGVLWRGAAVALDLDATGSAVGRPAPAGSAALDAGLAAVMGEGGVVRAVSASPPGLLGPAAVERLHGLVAAGARLACPADPRAAALLAAGLPVVPALHLGLVSGRRLRQADVDQLVSLTPCPIVLSARSDDAPEVAAWLRTRAPLRRCWADDAALDVGVALVPFDTPADLCSRWPDGGSEPAVDRVFVVGPASGGGGRAVDLDAVVLYLADAGVPGRQIADALRPLGLRRSDIYQIIGAAPAPAPAPAGGGDADGGDADRP